MKKVLLPLLALTVSASAFSMSDTSKKNPSMASGTAPHSASMAKPQTDAEIVNMLMTVNTEEMNLSKLANEKSENPKVKEFAKKMLKEHAANNDKAAALRNNKNIKLTETGASNTLKVKVEDSNENLKTLKGKEFDQAFMDAQVSLHQKTLEKLESTLIPNSKDSQLKAMLQETKGHVSHHLKEAKDIQSSMQ